jgi:hypothetical protein
MTHSLSLISKHYRIYCGNNTNVKQHVLFDIVLIQQYVLLLQLFIGTH